MKFIVHGDPLLGEEESREKYIVAAQEPESDKPVWWVAHAVYMAEIEFENMTHISYEVNDSEELRILISVRRPVVVRKKIRNQVNAVRSPFNLHSQNMFINYWNVN